MEAIRRMAHTALERSRRWLHIAPKTDDPEVAERVELGRKFQALVKTHGWTTYAEKLKDQQQCMFREMMLASDDDLPRKAEAAKTMDMIINFPERAIELGLEAEKSMQEKV